MKLNHIGIAVKDIDEAVSTYEKLLDRPCYKRETVDSQQVEAAFITSGKSKVELLSATNEASAIQSFINKRGEGIHHAAFEVEDIRAEMSRLKEEGFTLLSDEPVKGADNKLVVFVHPKDNHGVLIELCQSL